MQSRGRRARDRGRGRPRLAPSASSRQKPPQRRRVVDIVPGVELDDSETERARALARLLGDVARCSRRCPRTDGMRRLHAEQVIAAVLRRAQHDAIAGLGECRAACESSAVGKVGLSEFSRQTASCPAANSDCAACSRQRPKPCTRGADAARHRQGRDACRRRACRRTAASNPRRRIGDIAGDRASSRAASRDILGDVAQKAGAQRRRRLGRQRRHEPGLHLRPAAAPWP